MDPVRIPFRGAGGRYTGYLNSSVKQVYKLRTTLRKTSPKEMQY